MTSTTKTSFYEAPAADVAGFFVNGYRLQDGERLVRHEYFFDPTKGVFVFKLVTETAESPAAE